jgi:hypothetical protein
VVFLLVEVAGNLGFDLGSTGTAKWAPYRYRVRRGYVYRWGTAACVPQAYPISAKKKNFRYGFGTGQVRVGSGPVRGEPKRRRLA